MKTKHPAAGMTRAQKETFEQIAINCDSGHHPRTIKKLLQAGLIEQEDDKILGRGILGVISVPTYSVPLHWHWQWCEWCAEQPEASKP